MVVPSEVPYSRLTFSPVQVIRRAGNVTEGRDDKVFKPLGWDDFVQNTARLENLPNLSPESIFLMEVIRDVVDIKKLNNHLMKVTMFEDLIADLYSRLYEINMPQIFDRTDEETKEKMKVDNILATYDGASDAVPPPAAASSDPLQPPQPRGRTKGIARKDIQKRAEAIVNRRLSPRTMTLGRITTAVATPPRVMRAASVEHAEHPAKDKLREIDDTGSGQHSSIPNSVHDSADDESELSEIDDERLSKLERRNKVHPNLLEGHVSERASVDGDAGDIHMHDVDQRVPSHPGEGGDAATVAVKEEQEGAEEDEADVEVEGDEGPDEETDDEEEVDEAEDARGRKPEDDEERNVQATDTAGGQGAAEDEGAPEQGGSSDVRQNEESMDTHV